jgi:hypothetical protein
MADKSNDQKATEINTAIIALLKWFDEVEGTTHLYSQQDRQWFLKDFLPQGEHCEPLRAVIMRAIEEYHRKPNV